MDTLNTTVSHLILNAGSIINIVIFEPGNLSNRIKLRRLVNLSFFLSKHKFSFSHTIKSNEY